MHTQKFESAKYRTSMTTLSSVSPQNLVRRFKLMSSFSRRWNCRVCAGQPFKRHSKHHCPPCRTRSSRRFLGFPCSSLLFELRIERLAHPVQDERAPTRNCACIWTAKWVGVGWFVENQSDDLYERAAGRVWYVEGIRVSWVGMERSKGVLFKVGEVSWCRCELGYTWDAWCVILGFLCVVSTYQSVC